MKMKRIIRLALCALLLAATMPHGTAEREIPDVLRVTQDIETIRLEKYYRIITWSVLHSAREDVNDAMNARVNALREEAERLIPRGKDFKTRTARADICTQITRTGSRWMSFHICAQISAEYDQQWVKCEDYTYEMETGRLIRLGEIIREDGWETLTKEIRTQLEAFFPEETPDGDTLDMLCRRDNLEDAGFVMAPGHLALYFPAADIYTAHSGALLRVEIYVPGLWEILTEEARRETDCTGYNLVALTYDDGPGKGTTRAVLNASIRHPGQLTFFIIGDRIKKNAELLHREFDAGHSVQSHSWDHRPESAKPSQVPRWEARFNQVFGSSIGTLPTMMRPPGGESYMFAKAGCKLPMILWSVNSNDASVGEYESDLLRCYGCAIGAGDGDIVLFHDIKSFAGELAEECMDRYEENNLLLVTVNDLCALRGIPLETGATVSFCPRDGEKE